MTTVEMLVHMDCPGCVSKIRKALRHLKGIDNIDIDVAMQKVTVTGSADQMKVLKTVRKTGRRAELWQLPYDPVIKNHNTNTAVVPPNANNYGAGGPAAGYMPALISQPPAASSYNYYKHGYDYGQDHQQAYFHGYGPYGGHHQYGQSRIFGSWAGDAFSEESVHGCSVM
ncbi:OLC1v1023752C1 [Oldenlandia corymbosa var. corymbosa]|uniref:OLC1v1023752C1 n=1 Tax=Oldenlandia corymbosa var. corymbosa TaxID=529605 RepID=A0AAV1C0P1_OLDCO|nr:OLC1v1023752C1 [Oldenlandia corymbosa var. corymbosa]